MTSDGSKRLDFKDMISPHLEVLLRFSFWLTRNGRDATRLMQEAIAEAYRSWDETMSEGNYKLWLQKILARRFLNGFQQYARPLIPISGGTFYDGFVKDNRPYPAMAPDVPQHSWQAGGSHDDVDYFEAFAALPAVYRSAMILSYLEGFSNDEIADLAGVQPYTIDSLLNRGRGLLRKELFAHLMGDNCLDTVANRVAAAG